MKLIWEDGDTVAFDSTIVFGKGYCFDGLESHAKSAIGEKGNYLLWPRDTKNSPYSLYRDSDGALSFEQFKNEEECMKRAQEWEDE